MKKSSLIALITVSSLVLNQATVLANETDPPVDSTVTVLVETPVDTTVTTPTETPIYNSPRQDDPKTTPDPVLRSRLRSTVMTLFESWFCP